MKIGVARVCSSCGDEVVDSERHCAACGGAHTDRACDACGVILQPGDVTCPACSPPAQTNDAPASRPVGDEHDDIDETLQLSLADEYRLTRVISRTPRATIYEADDLARQRVVAIKVLANGRIIGELAAREFLSQAKRIAALKHPYLRGIHAVRQLDDEFMLVMPLVEGQTLAAMLAEQGPLSVDTVRHVAQQIGEALDHAHRQGVTHGDVRSSHIVLHEDGNALLTDFTIISHEASGVATRSASYLSPEQCDGVEVDGLTDQYALGIVLYEMLTGTVPFEARTMDELRSLIQWEPLPIRMSRDDCPMKLEQVILRMIAKHPPNRWASMAEAVERLDASLAVSPPPTSPSPILTGEIELVDSLNLFPNVVASWPAAETDMPFIDDPMSAIDFVEHSTPVTATPAVPPEVIEPVVAPAFRPVPDAVVAPSPKAYAPPTFVAVPLPVAPVATVPVATARPTVPRAAPRARVRRALLGAGAALIAIAAFVQWGDDIVWSDVVPWRGESATVDASFNPATFFAATTLRAVSDSHRQIAPAPVIEDFSVSDNDPKMLVVDGRASLAAGVHGYGPARWRASTRDMAVHVDIVLDPRAESHEGGLVLRAARRSNYFLHLSGLTDGGFAITLRNASGDSILVPLTREPSIHAGRNRVDVLVISNRLSAFVNGTRLVDSLELPFKPDGQVGVFGSVSTGVEFDNLAIATMTRR